jgi:peptidoglycan/LPS O-acetylase OafA/YrhL
MISTASKSRNERIDVLRGVAIACVLVLHFTLAYGLKDSPVGSVLPRWLLAGLTLNGNYGVTMFFAISGFLITSISLRRWGSLARIDLRSFYVYRAARILPPLLLVLAVIVALGCLGLPLFSNTDDGHHLPASYFIVAAGSVLTFWHNVLMQHSGYFNYCLNIYWSLSVEEVFYLLMPLLCLGLRRNGAMLAACLGFIALGPWYRARHLDDEIFYLYAYQACFDAISFGCVAAFAAAARPFAGRWANACRWTAALALVVVYLVGIAHHVVWGFTEIAAGTALFLYASAHAAPLGPRALALTASLRWLGRHTYELYLVHIIVLAALQDVTGRAEMTHDLRLPWMALFLLLSCAAAAATARWVAQPVETALRRRFLRQADDRSPVCGPASGDAGAH